MSDLTDFLCFNRKNEIHNFADIKNKKQTLFENNNRASRIWQ